MRVENRIVKVQKRNRALVRFDQGRILDAILRAGRSIGGFHEDYIPGVNQRIFAACGDDETAVARFLADAVVVCLNANPHHLIANFPPTIEAIQDKVLHALRSYGFQHTSDAYACYRWGRHWLREGALTLDQFAGNGLHSPDLEASLAFNRAHGCDTLNGLNELVRRGRLGPVAEASLARYEQSLDAAADALIARLSGPDPVRILWVSGPSCSGKTTTTIKLTQRLERAGVRFVMMNLDDYFWSLVEHPTDWINDRNYETPEALDIQLLNGHLRALLDGAAVEKPVYSFKEGRRTATRRVRLEPGQILILDCLHGLYPPMTEGLPPAAQFHLYLEAQNGLYEGDGSTKRLTRTSDARMLRRMLRDGRHRNHGPLHTVLHWHYVRAGELFSIIPLRGRADHTINGGFPFDLPALKPFFSGPSSALPQPSDLDDYGGFLDARIRLDRVAALLDSVEGLAPETVADHSFLPGDALAREFLGGSTLHIPHND